MNIEVFTMGRSLSMNIKATTITLNGWNLGMNIEATTGTTPSGLH